MDISNPEARDFLVELYNQTEGNEELQVSMHDVGATLGMDKNEAGALAEELIVEGLVELRTLAGGVSVTPQGLGMLQEAGYISITAQVKDSCQLSGALVLSEGDRQAVEQLVGKIKDALSGTTAAYQTLEEIVVDIKTVEVHLLSPQPKTAIVREILRSLHGSLKRLDLNEVALYISGVLE